MTGPSGGATWTDLLPFATAPMAANLSARKRASLVLAQPVLQLVGAFLRITCPCGRVSWLHAPDLAVSGRDVTLAEGIRKLRCSGCRSTAGQVVLAPRYPPQHGTSGECWWCGGRVLPSGSRQSYHQEDRCPAVHRR